MGFLFAFYFFFSPKAKKIAKTATKKKPVPQIGEGGVEDDEAEDLGVNAEGGSAKSDERSSNEADSDEDTTPKKKDDAENGDKSEEDESKEDDESGEERDDPGESWGLFENDSGQVGLETQ